MVVLHKKVIRTLKQVVILVPLQIFMLIRDMESSKFYTHVNIHLEKIFFVNKLLVNKTLMPYQKREKVKLGFQVLTFLTII